jgi:hypothetical protein
MESGGRNEDGVERGAGRESERAVASDDMHVAIAESNKEIACGFSERRVTFNGENFRGEFREQRGSVTGSGSNLENLIVGSELERFEHDRNNVGLRNGLAVGNGKRMIFVGLGAVSFGHKLVAGNAQHRAKDARVSDAAVP